MTGAKIVIETLIEQGVDCVFGFPGGTVLNIYDELYKNNGRIKHYITCHEQGAAHAADGYARATGKPGVVIATSGPGATNLVTGIATAYMDSVPLIAITGNVALPLLGRDSFQEIDITGITMPVTKHNYIVREIRDLAETIREAFRIAVTGRPGPVLIDIPKDIQTAEYGYEPETVKAAKIRKNPSNSELLKAAELIASAERPFIYAGGGVIISGASEELLALAERIDAPVGLSMMGLTAMPYDNPRNMGMTGMHGKYASSVVSAGADLVIAVGVRFSDRATGNKTEYCKNARTLHIDIDPAEINKNIPAYSALIGDVKQILAGLLEILPVQQRNKWNSEINEIKKHPGNDRAERYGQIEPEFIYDSVKKYLPADGIVATDVGQHQMWTAQHYKFTKPRTFITSGGLGTMGFGLGAAIGTCIGTDRTHTVLFTGDGSFHMNLNELATAVTNRLPLTVIIMNNNTLGMVRQWQSLFFGKRYSNTTLNRATDYVKLAEAFGAKGFRITEKSSAEAIIKKAILLDEPVVIDCVIDIDEMVLPMIPAGGTVKDIIVK